MEMKKRKVGNVNGNCNKRANLSLSSQCVQVILY